MSEVQTGKIINHTEIDDCCRNWKSGQWRLKKQWIMPLITRSCQCLRRTLQNIRKCWWTQIRRVQRLIGVSSGTFNHEMKGKINERFTTQKYASKENNSYNNHFHKEIKYIKIEFLSFYIRYSIKCKKYFLNKQCLIMTHVIQYNGSKQVWKYDNLWYYSLGGLPLILTFVIIVYIFIAKSMCPCMCISEFSNSD